MDDEISMQRQLIKLIDKSVIELDLIEALSGDRELRDDEKRRINEIKSLRGNKIYSDIFFVLCNRYFPPDEAKKMWDEVLSHKYVMSSLLGRNVKISVAIIDYFFNIKHLVEFPVFMSKSQAYNIAELAIHDGLTSLYDHSTFISKLDREFDRYKRYNSPLSIIMIDIDNMKQVNDRYGHVTGDMAIMEVAHIIKMNCRDLDIPARYGGDEFAIILSQTNAVQASEIAKRILNALRSQKIENAEITLSMGIAECAPEFGSPNDFIAVADKALYRSKREGKNRINIACPPFS